MDNKSYKMDERNNGKQNSDPSLIGQLLKKTSLIMSQVSDTFELSGELRSAIKDENIAEIRWGWCFKQLIELQTIHPTS